MRKLTSCLVFIALCVFVSTRIGRGDDQKKDEAQKPDPKKVKALMQLKLVHSQKVLEGLAINDLDKAAKNAKELILIRKEAAWMVVKTKEYELWSDEFNRSVNGIITAAKDKNLEAAKLSYLSMTLACFNCHSYVRDLGQIHFERENLP